MKLVDKNKKRSSIHDVTILDDGKIVIQQVPTAQLVSGAAGSCLMGTGLYPSANTVGDDDLFSSLIDRQCNISSHVPNIEDTSGAIDLFESLLDCLDDISTPQGPSGQQTTDPAGVSLCTPLITTQHISTPEELMAEEMIASADVDFCDSLFIGQDDLSNSQGSMTGQVTGTAEAAHILNFEESSLPVHPDFGVHAPPTASQPSVEPVPSDVGIPGLFSSPWSSMFELDSPDYAAFFDDFPDDMVTQTYTMPPSDQN